MKIIKTVLINFVMHYNCYFANIHVTKFSKLFFSVPTLKTPVLRQKFLDFLQNQLQIHFLNTGYPVYTYTKFWCVLIVLIVAITRRLIFDVCRYFYLKILDTTTKNFTKFSLFPGHSSIISLELKFDSA